MDVTETRVRIKAAFDITQEINRGSHLTLHDRKSGVVRRTVRLPKKVIPQEAEAEYENGVLKVEIPKQEKKPKVSKSKSNRHSMPIIFF